MPVMDGYEATRRIRDGEAGDPEVPIVALTAHALEGDAQKCTGAGMDAYLAKPLGVEVLRGTLARWLTDHSASVPALS
jgi:CheY-like chemotaxis protein